MPELFCGFDRQKGRGPTLYPVACSPQSWAAGAVFLMLQACLGLSIDAVQSRILFYRPYLPEALQRVRLSNLTVGNASVDLLLERYSKVVGVDVLSRTDSVDVIVIK